MPEFWRCERCHSLLGVHDHDDLCLKNKTEITVVTGDDFVVSRVCRRCLHKNMQRFCEPPTATRTA